MPKDETVEVSTGVTRDLVAYLMHRVKQVEAENMHLAEMLGRSKSILLEAYGEVQEAAVAAAELRDLLTQMGEDME